MADARNVEFNDLIDDNLVEILLQLDGTLSYPEELKQLRLVNKRFDALIKNNHHTVSTAKYALCIAAVAAIALSVALACALASVAIASLAGVSMIGFTVLFGISGATATKIAFGSIACMASIPLIGLPSGIALFGTNNFFSRHINQYEANKKAEELAVCASEVVRNHM